MSYDERLLFEKISVCLHESPRTSLEGVSVTLRVSKRTIKKAIRASTGRSFRNVRDEILLARVKCRFASHPEMAIKELSFGFGFRSASSFARAIKRVCGSSPEDLRSLVARELPVRQRAII